MRRIHLAWTLVLVAAALAGCLDGPTSDAPADPPADEGPTDARPDGTSDSPSSGSESNADDGTEDDPDGADDLDDTPGEDGPSETEPATRWNETRRSGNITGAGLIVTGPETVRENITLDDATRTVWFNLTLDGDPVNATLEAPDGQNLSLVPDNGSVQVRFTDPVAGNWTVVLGPEAEPGLYEASYALIVAREIPA